MNFYVPLSFLTLCFFGSGVSTKNDGRSDELLWEEENFRPVRFSQPTYKATVLRNNSIVIMDGPILLENTYDGMYFVITTDNYEDYSISIVETNGTTTNKKQLNIELSSSEPIKKEFDIIILEALDENLVPVARSSVLVFSSIMDYDPYKMTFTVGSSEYIVLNYDYFRWFLFLLTMTGLLILAIEVHEIVRNVRNPRQKDGNRYQELQNVVEKV